MQHAAINPRLIKLGFILRQANVIQPPWAERQSVKNKPRSGSPTVCCNKQQATHSSPSCSPAFPCCPLPLSRGPVEPIAASFCAVDAWCLAPKCHKKNWFKPKDPWCASTNLLYFISPSRGLFARPVEESDRRRSTHEPCWHTGRDPAPAASHTPDPWTSEQMEHRRHLKNNKKLPKSHPGAHFKARRQTYLLALWKSRDHPSLGPAVARTPPLLNSPSARFSSRLNVVDWLLFNLKWEIQTHTNKHREKTWLFVLIIIYWM